MKKVIAFLSLIACVSVASASTPHELSIAPIGFSIISILRGLLGMVVILGICYLLSSNRKAISWRVVGIGLLLQIIFAFSILYIPAVQTFFEFFGKCFIKVVDFTKSGTEFLFGGLFTTQSFGFVFALQILPTIIFFAALTSLLFYLGVIQKVVGAMAWVMVKIMKLSGAESLSVAGNIFLGQTESPLMVKGYIPNMNRSELFLVMAGGMATIAGGVLAAYISMLGGGDPAAEVSFAKHLISASVMAAPGVIVIAKILVPQTDDVDLKVQVSKDVIGDNVLDSVSKGTTEGVKLAANIAGMLLVFIAFITMFNYMTMKVGYWCGLNDWISQITDGKYHEMSLQFLLGYAFSPLMWLVGVSSADITYVGSVLGEKLILTEFIGYSSLAQLKTAGVFSDPKSVIMATYMLCGFANFASIGIQIGGIGILAPNKRVELAQLGIKALIAGALTSILSATIVGAMLI